MGSKSFSYRSVLGFGWNVMKNNFWFFVGVGVVLFLISLPSQVLGNLMENYPGKIPPPLAILLLPVTFIVEIIVGIGLIKIALSFCDGQRPKFSTLFNAWGCFWKYIGAGILYCLIVGGTFIACVLPLILLSGTRGNPRFAFVFFTVGFTLAAILAIQFSLCFYFVIDKGLSPINALRASSRTTLGAKWSLFGFGILCSLINLLGVLCFGVGLFATFPTVAVAMALVYRQLSAMTPGMARLGIDGPDVQPASRIPLGIPMRPGSITQSDIPLGLGVRLTRAVQTAPNIESGPHIQPDKETQRGKNNFLLPAVILGIIVIGAGIAYLFRPTVKGAVASCRTVGSCKTVVSNKQVKLTGILYSDDPLAIVDGEIAKEGDTINGTKVVKIHRDEVEFEKDGEKWTQQVR